MLGCVPLGTLAYLNIGLNAEDTFRCYHTSGTTNVVTVGGLLLEYHIRCVLRPAYMGQHVACN